LRGVSVASPMGEFLSVPAGSGSDQGCSRAIIARRAAATPQRHAPNLRRNRGGGDGSQNRSFFDTLG
jgi:hypothetical protein